MFLYYLRIMDTFEKWASCSSLAEKLKNDNDILVGSTVLEFLIKTCKYSSPLNVCHSMNLINLAFVTILHSYESCCQANQFNDAHLRGYCTPDHFCDCLCIFLENYKMLVTSKICFLLVTFQGT